MSFKYGERFQKGFDLSTRHLHCCQIRIMNTLNGTESNKSIFTKFIL